MVSPLHRHRLNSLAMASRCTVDTSGRVSVALATLAGSFSFSGGDLGEHT
jgi:hypothetical protein